MAFQNLSEEEKKAFMGVREQVFAAIGQASMCWSLTPAGVFATEAAEKVATELLAHVEAHIRARVKGQSLDPALITRSRAELACMALWRFGRDTPDFFSEDSKKADAAVERLIEKMTPFVQEPDDRAKAAIATLDRLGYTWEGGIDWMPPGAEQKAT